MKKIIVILVLGLTLGLVACNTTTEKDTGSTELIPIAVDITIQPDTINPGDEVTISATVTQGEDAVEDADEVKFEISQDGKDESEFLEGEHSKDGQYVVTKTFEEDAIYYVTAHVTARSMHNMPKVEVVVGSPDAKTEETTGSNNTHEHPTSQHGHGHVAIETQFEEVIEVNKETKLQTYIEEAGLPLEDANVRFEIWIEGNDKHEFIETSEEKSGVYNVDYTFKQNGTYHVQVHVEKEDIHEHIEKTIEVK
ncbi:FixH family protein [Fredinandcohnia sp. 179-A 10B2 NHS]|uniref:FixH family protein n=1 Tax=Fredinandcohnia sp. 179-A 10B2 NHS TaxID=3235176 RepID=UPI0039A14217